jgi:hypothetical protein
MPTRRYSNSTPEEILRVGGTKNKTAGFKKLSVEELKKRGGIPTLNQNGKSATLLR